MIYEASNLTTLDCFEHKIIPMKEMLAYHNYEQNNGKQIWNSIVDIGKSIKENGMMYPLMVYELECPWSELTFRSHWMERKIYHLTEKKAEAYNEAYQPGDKQYRTCKPDTPEDWDNLRYFVKCGCQRYRALWDLGCTAASCRVVPIKYGDQGVNNTCLEHISNGSWSLDYVNQTQNHTIDLIRKGW
jgi:hypothetical protein